MKKLSEVPFDKIYVGMPIIVRSINLRDYKAEIIGKATRFSIFPYKTIWYKYLRDDNDYTYLRRYEYCDCMFLDPTRM